MRVILLIDSLVSGGRERRLIELIKGFDKYADVELHLVVFSDKIHYQEVFELGIPITILKRVPKKNPMVFFKLYRLCKTWRPDVMHSWGTMSAIWAIPSSKLLGIPLVNGNVTDAPKNMSFFDERLFRARLTYPFSNVVVGNSFAGLKEYRVPKKKKVCIYNGFDMNRISELKDKVSVRKELAIHAQRVIGMVGAFYDRKDYETFLNAGLRLLKERDEITFIAVGDGPNLAKCKEMIPVDYDKHFIFTGARKDVESLINIFDIGVLATNDQVHGEGISNAILEYMILKKPLVATSGGGTNEIVDHMNTGILIEPGSASKLAKKLNYLLEHTEEATKMALAGEQRIKSMFSLDKMTSAYYDLYQRLLTRK